MSSGRKRGRPRKIKATDDGQQSDFVEKLGDDYGVGIGSTKENPNQHSAAIKRGRKTEKSAKIPTESFDSTTETGECNRLSSEAGKSFEDCDKSACDKRRKRSRRLVLSFEEKAEIKSTSVRDFVEDDDCGAGENPNQHSEASKRRRKEKSKKISTDCSHDSTNGSSSCGLLFREGKSVEDCDFGGDKRRKQSCGLALSFEEKDEIEFTPTKDIDSDRFKTSTPCMQPSRRKRKNNLGLKELGKNDSAENFHDEVKHQVSQNQQSSVTKRRGRPPKKSTTSEENVLLGESVHSDSGENATDEEKHQVSQNQPSSVTKRRGRPSKKSTTSEENVLLGNSMQPDSGENATNAFSCCHCGKSNPNSSSIRHHMAVKHHRVWSTSCHEGTFSELGAFKILKSIRCLKCDKLCHTFQLFRIHSKWCGREEERADCHVCGKSVRVMTYGAHVRYAHQEKPEVEEKQMEHADETAADISSSTGRTVRKAAVKARSKLRELTTEFGSSSTVSYSKPQYVCLQNTFPVSFVKNLETQMKKHQKLSCCYQGCSSTHMGVADLVDHLLACACRPDFAVSTDAFTCLGCGKFFETEQSVSDHITEHSWDQQNRDGMGSETETNEFSGSDTSSEDEESDEDDDSEDDDDGDKSTVGKTQGSRKRGKYQKGLLSMESFYQSHSYSNIFPGWKALPSLYHEVSEDSGMQWLPENLDYSFKIQTGPKDFSPVVRLGLFETFSYNESYSINVGGPLWALAWCPTPPKKTVPQFLAVYTHRTENETHLVNECSSQTTLIQLWKFQLPDCNVVELEKPEFVGGLLLDCGPIWGMSWCPTGAWEDGVRDNDSSATTETVNEGISRIGLLAIASHSGYVHILSMPSSFSTNNSGVDNKPLQKLYRVTPVATLLRRGSSENNPCLCLDWHWKEKCGLLAAGFSDGVVCLWDLNTSSPLLRRTNNDGCERFLPYRIMRCHSWPVKGVAFCPLRINIMATCSADRLVKVWDLTEPEYPLSSLPNTMNTAVLWPATSAHSFFCAGDDCYQCERNSTILCFNANNRIQTRPLTIHNATVWGMSFNCWTDLLVSCDSAGVVVKIPWISITQKCVTDIREVLFVVENSSNSLESVDCDAEVSIQNSGSNGSNTSCLECNCICHVYDMNDVAKKDLKHGCPHCKSQRCLTFKDFSSKWKFSNKCLYHAKQLPADNISDSLSCALYRVAWNTNTDYTRWLALGGQAGILHIRLVEERKKSRKNN